MPYPETPDATWRAGVDMDLQATMALARASATALLELSAESNREMRQALAVEIAALELIDQPDTRAAANLVRQCIPTKA